MDKNIEYYRKELATINISLAQGKAVNMDYFLKLREELMEKQFYSLYGWASYILVNNYIRAVEYEKVHKIIEELKSYEMIPSTDQHGKIKLIENKEIQAYTNLIEAFLCWYDSQDWDCCISKCDKVLELTSSIASKDKLAVFFALLIKGITYCSQKDYLNAFRTLLESTQLKLDEVDSYNESKALQFLGIVESNLGHEEEAVNYFIQSADIYKKHSLLSSYASILGNIGDLNATFDNLDTAISNFQESLDIAVSLNSIHNIADNYLSLGKTFELKNEYEKAEAYYLDAIKTYQKLKYLPRLYNATVSLGNLYTKMEQYEKAKKLLLKGLRFIQKYHNHDSAFIANVYAFLAAFYQTQKDYKNTEKFLKKSEQLCTEHDLKKELLTVYQNIIKYHTEREQYKKAYEYTNLLNSLNIELIKKQVNSKLATLNIQNEMESVKREMNQKIENERLKTVMAMAVTANHEINQPLTLIQFSVDFLKNNVLTNSPPEKQLKYINKIESNVQKIFDILTKYANNENFIIDNYLNEKTKMVKFID